ncbi:hypothetical protein [Flavilitoribacter nigricans]|nr:hypothetical protein [Flavilitoribacter nigricans]
MIALVNLLINLGLIGSLDAFNALSPAEQQDLIFISEEVVL